MLLQGFSSRLSLERASRTNVLPHLYFAISLYPQKLRIAHPEMHCHLVPLSHLHLFNRELPISPDFVGKNVPSSHEENVHLYMKEVDGHTAVEINDVAPGSHVGSAPLGGE